MQKFEIECVDATTFKSYKTLVSAETIEEARATAAGDGHKLLVPEKSLNPQLVPASIQTAIPMDSESDGYGGGVVLNETRRSDSQTVLVLLFAVVLVGLVLAGFVVFWIVRLLMHRGG